jgi:hypothetical protein
MAGEFEMFKYSTNSAPDTRSAHPDVPDTIPTILLPESDTNDFTTRLETYLQTGWRVVGKMSMTDPETISSAVNDYVVLQPVQTLPPDQFSRWQQ